MRKTKNKITWLKRAAIAAALVLQAQMAGADPARDRPAHRNVIAIGPMLQKEFGPMQGNVNLLFERQLGSGAEPGAEISYAWQLKWRGNPRFEPGIQGFGTVGRTNDFGHETEHRVGPAFFSQVLVGARNKLKF